MDEQAYIRIAEAIDRGPQRAPKVDGQFSKTFLAYLKLIYTPEEAAIIQYLNMPAKYNFKSAGQVADESGLDIDTVKEVLDSAARRNAIFRMGDQYSLLDIPGILNYHHFSPEIGPEDVTAARLYQDFFIKEGYYKLYEGSEKGTPIVRTIPVSRAIAKEEKVLTNEEAHQMITNQQTNDFALVPCPCRTRTEKMGIRECRDRFPIASCIFIGAGAKLFTKLGLGKMVTREQALSYFDEMQDLGLVGNTDNYLNPNQSVICLCCECCCSQVRGRTRWDNPDSILPSNFVSQADENCILCETCLDRCFFGALSVDEDAGRVVCDPEKCIGCGICTITCPTEALKLHRYERTRPFDSRKELWTTITVENREA